ncbi:SLBB domain-containing protein [Alkalinema sp. FACHB-956]|uniref:SLBB domain-containing protein n=1 Tax=Alkalinema sp. FACHB-956 TaxID=2692768 RepID=UPI00168A22C1|nr:SLBB domain-containing protein [Alkalinema sp. FACHB-956]MBD2329744.1 SLBB domain-containing protein [Alkalinema sp. FACHB-956]
MVVRFHPSSNLSMKLFRVGRLKTCVLGTSLLATLVGLLPPSAFAQTAIPRRSTQFPPNAVAPVINRPPIDEDYILGPGDRVRIDVQKAPQYSLETQVLVDGTISLLQFGSLPVRNLSLTEATARATEKYRKVLRYPVVTITLVTPRPVKVTVAGEVSRRGAYDVTLNPVSDTGNTVGSANLPTLTRALKLAGGITQSADLNRVEIRRAQRGGSAQVYTVNLWDFVRNGDTSQDAVLRDGDSIFVPTAANLDLNESYQLATTSFSAEKIQPLNITVVGEVYRPGTHTVESSVRVPTAGIPGEARDSFNQARIFPTLTRAIQTAGGIKPMANLRNIEVRRITQQGTQQVFKIDLWALLQAGDQTQDLILQDRDTIVIPQATNLTNAEIASASAASFSPDRIRVAVMGEVGTPGVIEVPPNTPLNKAILTAGGFNSRAVRNKVDFVRLNPDGTAVKREVKVDLAAGYDEANNPPLRNEDVIIVKRSGLSVFGEAGQVFGPLGGIVSVFRAIFGGP